MKNHFFKIIIGLFLCLPLFGFTLNGPYIFDLNIGDIPFNSLNDSFNYPSMNQALDTAEALHESLYLGLDTLFPVYRKGWMRFFYGLASGTAEILYLYLPGGSAWLHEEFHRAILTKNDVSSFDEVNTFPIFQSLIQVEHVKDSDLIHLKQHSTADWLRLQEAGIEGERLLVRRLRMRQFFERKNASRDGVLLLIETLNPLLYLWTCTQTSSDAEIDRIEKTQTNMMQRDFTGYDFTAWVHDLFHSTEPYTNRGFYPDGSGVDRYIRVSDLSTEELGYLKSMVWLNALNLIAPSSIGIQAFRWKWKTRFIDWNFDLAHFLTPFGFAVDFNLYLKSGDFRWFITLRNQFNKQNWYPALEFTQLRRSLSLGKLRIFLSPSLAIWLQPKNLLFEDQKGKLGGDLSLRGNITLAKFVDLYIEARAKSAGWNAGWLSLDPSASLMAGLHWKLF